MVELLKGMSQFDMVNITMRKVIENRNLVSGFDQITKENQVPLDYDDKNVCKLLLCDILDSPWNILLLFYAQSLLLFWWLVGAWMLST